MEPKKRSKKDQKKELILCENLARKTQFSTEEVHLRKNIFFCSLPKPKINCESKFNL